MSTFAEMDADQLTERLLYVVRNSKHDALFTGASAVDLVMKIHGGVRTMVNEERTSEDDLREASEHLRGLLTEMDAVRAGRGEAFQEETVSYAFLNLCPGFWPFC